MSKNPNISIGFSQGKFAQEVNQMAAELKNVKKEFEITNLSIEATGDKLALAESKIRGFAQETKLVRAATEAMQKGFEDAANTQQKLALKVEVAKQAYESALKSEGKSSEEVQKLKTEYDNLVQRLNKAEKAVGNWKNKIQDSQIAENKLKVAIKQTNDEIDKHNKGLEENAKKTKNVTTASGQMYNVFSLIRGLAIGYAGKTLYDSLIGGNAQFEQYMASFEVLLGGADKAKKRMQELTQFAAVTPFELPQVVEAEKRLLAYGVAAKDTAKVQQMLGDISMGNAEKLNMISLAYGQVVTNAKLYGTELRQFAENGVPLLAELAKMYGKTEAEMRGMIEDGMISADAVTAALERMTSKGGKFFGMMQKQSQTMQGMWSTLKDNINLFAREVGENSFDYLKGELGSFMDELNSMSQSGELSNVADEWGRNIATFVGFVADAVKILWEMKEALIGLGAALAVTSMLNTAAGAFEALRATVLATKAGFDAAKVSNDILNASLIKSPWGAAAIAIGLVVGALVTYKLATGDAETETDKLIKKTSDLTDEYERNLKAIDRQTNAGQGEMVIAQKLAGELEKLSGKTNKTTEEKARMAQIVDQLNNKIPNLALQINAETGELNKQVGVVYDAIEAYKQLLFVKAGEKKASSAAESLLDLKAQREALNKELDALNAKESEIEAKRKTGKDSLKGANSFLYDPDNFMESAENARQISRIKDSILENEKAIVDAEEQIRNSFKLSEEYAKKFGSGSKNQKETGPYTPPPFLDPKDDGKKAKKAAEDAFKERRKLSDLWIEDQKRNNAISVDEEIAAYERIRAYVKEYYSKGVIDRQEYAEQINDIDKSIFDVRKKLIEDEINKTFESDKKKLDARKKAIEEEEYTEKKSFDARKKAIEDYYDSIDLKEKQQDRSERLKELVKEENRFRNAATEEGQEKLKQIREEIEKLNKEAEKEKRDIQKNKKLAAVDKEIEKAEEDRKRRLEEIEKQYQSLDGTQKTLLDNISQYASNTAGVIEEVVKKVKAMLDLVSSLNISGGKSTAFVSTSSSSTTKNSYTLIDNGPKYINGKEDISDYGNELYGVLKNASRGG